MYCTQAVHIIRAHFKTICYNLKIIICVLCAVGWTAAEKRDEIDAQCLYCVCVCVVWVAPLQGEREQLDPSKIC